jgi:pimeloyl-ACP methyl ester carboxylesterase
MFGRWGAKKINRMVLGKQAIPPEAIQFMDAIMTHFKSRIDKEYLFSDDELKRLDMPVLLLGGTEDVIRPMEQVVERMRKFVPKLEAAIIPEMGHVLIGQTGSIIPFLRA